MTVAGVAVLPARAWVCRQCVRPESQPIRGTAERKFVGSCIDRGRSSVHASVLALEATRHRQYLPDGYSFLSRIGERVALGNELVDGAVERHRRSACTEGSGRARSTEVPTLLPRSSSFPTTDRR